MNDIAIRVSNLSKCYQIYSQPRDRLKQFVMPRLQRLVGQPPKQYFREFWALKDVSFEVKKGETVGIIGRNGSGKSTLLQMICGTLNQTHGDILTHGRVAALLELGSGFNPEFSGRENVYMNAAVLGLTKEETDARFAEIEAFAEIGDFIDQPVKTYSSGMYVRLAFAVSVNVDPEILIVDEALSVGDGRFQLKCFEKIKALKNSGKTILVVSHDLQTIRQICDRAILIDRGEFIQIGKPNDIVNHYTKLLFSNVPLPDEKVEEVKPVTSDSKEFKGANLLDENVTKEYRYGNFNGIIDEIYINGSLNDFNQTITSSDEFNVSFKAKAFRYINQPIFAMTIKSIKGFEVYGSNTYFRNMPFRPLNKDEEVKVNFNHKMRLIAGDYYISLGFVELVEGEIVPLDRRYDVIELKILPIQGDRSFGIANLESEIELTYSSESMLNGRV